MKTLILFALLAPAIALGQNLTEYKATNNKTYHIGDTVKFGKGSGSNGEFLYVQVGGLNGFLSRGHNQNMDRAYANTTQVVRKIKRGRPDPRSIEKLWFVVDNGNSLASYNVFIDDAISSCEVVPCASSSSTPATGVADEIAKLKKLLDSGAITQKEYDAQKKKLLDH